MHVTEYGPSIQPTVSIVMACFNASRYIREAILSLQQQTMPNWELLVIDDCSTDNSRHLVQDISAADSRVRLFTLEINQGPAVARNKGISLAKADWIAILDADDVSYPDRLRTQLAAAERLPGAVLIASGMHSLSADGTIRASFEYPSDHETLVHALEKRRAFPPHSSMLYKRSAVTGVGMFASSFVPSEDLDLWLRLSAVGNLHAVPEKLVGIRTHSNNISKAEEGRLQPRLALAAVTCHHLRKCGAQPPSENTDRDQWLAFLGWVEDRLITSGYYTVRTALFRAKARSSGYQSRMVSNAATVLHLLLSGNLVRYLVLRYSRLLDPSTLAQEWIGHWKHLAPPH